jgi:putative nucleotidyltransferase with HDIG domain
MPASILKISGMLVDINVSQRQIADAIRFDPVLAARILRMANSPVYAFQRSVSSLQMAVSAIGNQAIHDILLLGLTRDAFAPAIRNSEIGRGLWMHSLATGFAAREICAEMSMRDVEDAFSCGLLLDIGKMLLWRAEPEVYSPILTDTPHDKLHLAERAAFGFDHAEIGSLATRSWNLPANLCSAVAYHHDPELAVVMPTLTNLINVADHLAYRKLSGIEMDMDYLTSYSVVELAVRADQLDSVWERVLVSLNEVVRAFD